MDPTLNSILMTTLFSGVVSISAAASLSMGLLSRVADRLLSLSAGIMLSTALLHALPEALASQASPRSLFVTLLAGLLIFFLLEKVAIMHGGEHQAGHAHAGERSAWIVLAGDALHNFTDGIMIAAAFMANPGLGILTGLTIAAHEIPQEVGDFVVLLHSGYSKKRAYLWNLLCSLTAVSGGMVGYLMLDKANDLVPYVLTFASAGFLYVAVGHLMPQLQKKATLAETLPQLALMAIGILIFALL